VRDLDGLPGGDPLIPLVGHTRGHGIAIDTPEGWLNAGDAYFYRHEMGSPKRRCTRACVPTNG